jgi:trehalose/maltose transport system substrate-binding protein
MLKMVAYLLRAAQIGSPCEVRRLNQNVDSPLRAPPLQAHTLRHYSQLLPCMAGGDSQMKVGYLPARRTSCFVAARLWWTLLFLLLPACSHQPAHEPVTVTFLDVEWEASDKLAGVTKDLQDFSRETGIQVKRIPAPDSSLSQLALWKELLQDHAVAPDVVGIDVIWSGILDQYLMDLKPYFSPDLFSQNPVVVGSYTVGNKLVAIPHHAYVGVLLYRTDLLQQYGYREPPQTWDELEKMATRIQAGERARGQKDFWGYIWQGGIDEDSTCAGLEWQASEGGGRIIEDDRTVSVDNPQTILAWQRAARWVGSISPPGVIAYAKWDADNAWNSGKAAFFRGWVSDYSLISLHPPPRNASQFGVTSLPAGRVMRVSTLGGNGLAVSQASAHPREAMELIRFLQRRDIQLMRATEHSEAPKELVLYELPEILDPFPQGYNPGKRRAIVVARPSIVTGQKYEEVTRAYIRALHSVLTGEQSSAVAVPALAHELSRITGFSRGSASGAAI